MSDYETSQRKRNAVVGFFVIAGIVALVWLVFKFGDLPSVVSKVGSFEVFVQFPTAPGVQKDTPVRFCGYQIGRVTTVMAPEERVDLRTSQAYHQTVAVLSIDKRYVNIPSNVEIKLMTRGLGSSYIELTLDPAKLPAPPLDPNRPETCFLLDKIWLQGSTGVTSEFFPAESQKKLDDLVTSIIAMMENANEILGDPNNKENLKATLANLTVASKQAGDRLQEAKQTLEHVNATLEAATEAIEQAKPTIDEFRTFASTGAETLKSVDAKAERLVASLVVTSEELGRSASQLRLILEKVNAGKGSAGQLVNDGKLYEKLLENTEQIKSTLRALEAFATQAKERGLRIKF